MLMKGNSKRAMSYNYRKLIAEGKPPKQAKAIMLRKAGKIRGKTGNYRQKGMWI